MFKSRKTFPSHGDAFSYQPDPEAGKVSFNLVAEQGNPTFVENMQGVQPFRKVPNFFRRSKPNFNDPMAVWFVLDALVKSAAHTYIRSQYLAPFLQNTSPQFSWNTDNTGRILAGLWETHRETYLDEEDEGGMLYIPDRTGDGEPIPEEKRLHMLPFALGRDGRGKYYVIDPQNGHEGRLWLLKFQYIMGREAEKAMRAEAGGELGAFQGKAQTPSAWYLSLAPDPVQSAQAHLASLHPGRKTVRQAEVVSFDAIATA